MTTITALAALLREPGKPMTIEEISLREPGPGEIIVRTATVGICGTDLHFASGRFPYPLPTVLGHTAIPNSGAASRPCAPRTGQHRPPCRPTPTTRSS